MAPGEPSKRITEPTKAKRAWRMPGDHAEGTLRDVPALLMQHGSGWFSLHGLPYRTSGF